MPRPDRPWPPATRGGPSGITHTRRSRSCGGPRDYVFGSRHPRDSGTYSAAELRFVRSVHFRRWRAGRHGPGDAARPVGIRPVRVLATRTSGVLLFAIAV